MENIMAKPKLVKIVLNMGIKEALADKKVIEPMATQLAQITGQKPMVTKARKAIAAFKLRQGDSIGLKVTLRKIRMKDFLTKLVTIVLPRVRDFKGVSVTGFDGRGNYTMGLSELLVFPEVDYGKIDRSKGMEITFVTSAKDDKEAKEFLVSLGMPFQK